jgi:hypothetical protein
VAVPKYNLPEARAHRLSLALAAGIARSVIEESRESCIMGPRPKILPGNFHGFRRDKWAARLQLGKCNFVDVMDLFNVSQSGRQSAQKKCAGIGRPIAAEP